MGSFEELRSGLLKKYNVSSTKGSSGSQQQSEAGNPQKDDSDFQAIRSSLLEKYSEESTKKRWDAVSGWAEKYNSLMDSLSRESSRSGQWFTRQAIDDYSPQTDSLLKEYEGIKDYADRSGLPNASRYEKYLRNVQDMFRRENDWFLQDPDWLDTYTENQRLLNLDLEAEETAIAQLERQIEDYQYDWTDSRQRQQAKEDIQALQEQIDSRQFDLNRARQAQKLPSLSGVMDPEHRNFDPKFADLSGYQQPQTNDADRELYEYINNQNGFRDRYQKTWEAMEQFARNSDAPNMQDLSWLGIANGDPYTQQGYDKLTPDEVALYNYYYSQSPEKGREYLDALREDLMYRKAVEAYSDLEGNTLLELAFGVQAGVDQFQSGGRNALAALLEDRDYISPTDKQILSGMVREDLGNTGARLPEALGGGSLGQGAYDLITTSANMAPSILFSTLSNIVLPGSGAVVGTVTMGTSAAGNAYQQALNSGYDKTSAKAYGAAIGAAESALQYALGGIGKLGGKITGNAVSKALAQVENGILRAAGELGGSMLSEGGEEAIQEVLDPIFQNILLGADEDVDWGQAAYSGILGALSAGAMEGPGMVSQWNADNQQAKLLYGDRAPELVQEILEIDPGNDLAGRMQEKLETGTELSGRELRKLVQTKEKTASQQQLTAVEAEAAQMLQELGEPEGTLDTAARAAAKIALGRELTGKESRVYYGTGAETKQATNAQRVSKVLRPETILKEHGYTGGKSAEAGASLSLQERSKAYGAQAKAMVQIYRIGGGEQDVAKFDKAYRVAYDFGKAGGSFDYLSRSNQVEYLTPRQVEFAYQAGRAAANAVDTGGANDYYESNPEAQSAGNLTGGIPYGRAEEAGVHLRHGVQRPDGTDPGGQVRAVETAAGGVPQRQAAADGRSGAGRKAEEADSGRKVSAADLGLPGGSSRKNLTVVPETGKSPDLDHARAVARDNGLELVLFRGANLEAVSAKGKKFSAKAYIRGNTMYVRADHWKFSPEKLARHEAGHDMIAKGKVDPKRVYERLTEIYDDLVEQELPDGTTVTKSQYIEWVIEQYAIAYDLSDLSSEEVFEEILCDALADMNGFSKETAPLVEHFLENAKTEALAQAENGGVQKTGPPKSVESLIKELDTKYSAERTDYKDLSLSKEDLQNAVNQVAVMEPVANVPRGAFAKGATDLVTQVNEFFTSVGNLVYNDQLGNVILDRRGIKDDMAHGLGRKKAASFHAVPDVIRHGKVVDYQVNWKDRGYDTAVVAAPITMETETKDKTVAEEYLMGVVLIRSMRTNRFYVHEVLPIKKDGNPLFKTGTLSKDNPGSDFPSILSILNRILKVKRSSTTGKDCVCVK